MRTAERPRTTTRIPVWSDPGLRFASGQALLVAVMLLAGAAHLGPAGASALVLLVVTVAGTGLPLVARIGLGLSAWAFVTGFSVHAYGELSFAGADLRRLGVLVVGVVVLPVLPVLLRAVR